MSNQVVIAGAGAAGFFAAINIAEKHPDYHITILEKSQTILGKVRISGGGRCNVTHACFDPAELATRYPRGMKELRGPFQRFNPEHTIRWFREHGVTLKTESDGRIFPMSDDSETIITCFTETARRLGVSVRLGKGIQHLQQSDGSWLLSLSDGSTMQADKVILCTGSSKQTWDMLAGMGHSIISPVPSLFTFNIKDPRIEDIPGVSVPLATVRTGKLKTEGALLVTHWGLSGPAILKLSAWGARELATQQYHFPLTVNFLHNRTTDSTLDDLIQAKLSAPKKTILANAQFGLPQRLWEKLAMATGIAEGTIWADTGRETLRKLAMQLCEAVFTVNGKSTFKEEFVTAGGISLKEVDFKTMQSKLFPGLYFAGEILDIDAITGGYNFQAAWTESWLISESVTV